MNIKYIGYLERQIANILFACHSGAQMRGVIFKRVESLAGLHKFWALMDVRKQSWPWLPFFAVDGPRQVRLIPASTCQLQLRPD